MLNSIISTLTNGRKEGILPTESIIKEDFRFLAHNELSEAFPKEAPFINGCVRISGGR